MTFPTSKTPLRVPSVLSGKWVYLRVWEIIEHRDGSTSGYRSHGSSIWSVAATENKAFVLIEGLEPVSFKDRGSFEANAQALDEYLLSLGAEPAFERDGAWPAYCAGVVPTPELEATRTPFRLDDWDAADEEMVMRRGYTGVCDRTIKPENKAL